MQEEVLQWQALQQNCLLPHCCGDYTIRYIDIKCQ